MPNPLIASLMLGLDGPALPETIEDFMNRPEWHGRAACRGMGTALWFPVRGQSVELAKAICERCEVRQECLSAALELPDAMGVWGGLSERGRRALRKAVA